MQDFKDIFFPGKRWDPQIEDESEQLRRREAMDSDSMSMETESV